MSRLVVGADWSETPHLTDEAIADIMATIQPYQLEARSRGIPTLGSGAIYPFSETDIAVKDFDIPKNWKRGFGLDCALSGTTAMVWGAMDPETGTLYIYSTYKRSQADTAVHVEAIKARGAWIPGVGDAAGVVEADRTSFLDRYKAHRIDVDLPDKTVENGITDVYDMLSAGRLKVFNSCRPWFEEFRLYNRDKKGKVIKVNDHLLDATRYLVRSGRARMKLMPVIVPEEQFLYETGSQPQGWMR